MIDAPARIEIALRRFTLRDFDEGDRPAFLNYQNDPRYVQLYDFDPSDALRAKVLFQSFLDWRSELPRDKLQLGIFGTDGRLLGSAGLRGIHDQTAELGIELAPDQWGRFALATQVTAALVDYGFGTLGLDRLKGSTASGNTRVERLARYFGASVGGRRPGPEWMERRGWEEIDWAIDRETWKARSQRVP